MSERVNHVLVPLVRWKVELLVLLGGTFPCVLYNCLGSGSSSDKYGRCGYMVFHTSYIGMFSCAVFLWVVFCIKVFAAYLTRKAGRLTMNSLLMSLQMIIGRKSDKRCTNASLCVSCEVVPLVS